MPSAILNILIAVLVCQAVARHARKLGAVALRYFTVLSNLFCAASCLLVAAMWLNGAIWPWALTLKFVATVSVMVTLLTVFVFLLPQYGAKFLLTGPDFWLHLACPLLALATFLLWDRPVLTAPAALLGVVPVLLYGAVYMTQVVLRRKWEDFYGFNRGGKWPVSFAVMVIATALLSLLLASV